MAFGYDQQRDLGFLGQAAPAWTVCDNYYSAIMAETYPNRFMQHSAHTERITNSMTPSILPTIWDRLAAGGYTGRYYFVETHVVRYTSSALRGWGVELWRKWGLHPIAEFRHRANDQGRSES